MKWLSLLLLINYSLLLAQNPCPGVETVPYAGKTYNTVQIGDQCWLKENLNVGTKINSDSLSDNQTDNGIIEKYCYDNDESNCATYGGLYQWDEAMQYTTQEGTIGICPSGWHIPTLAEFEALEDYVNDQAAPLVDESQNATAYTPTNETGFSALFAGHRNLINGGFSYLGSVTYFWSSAERSSGQAHFRGLWDGGSDVFQNFNFKSFGFSVRCLNDEPVAVEEIDNPFPDKYELSQNYPNPFNPTTTFEFELPERGYTTLTVYNQMGQTIETLVNNELNAGKYKYEFDGTGLSSGIYYYRITSGNYSETKKMSLLK